MITAEWEFHSAVLSAEKSDTGAGKVRSKCGIQSPVGQIFPGLFRRNAPQTVEALAQVNFPPIVIRGPLPYGIFPIQFFHTEAAVPDKGVVAIAVNVVNVFSYMGYLLF